MPKLITTAALLGALVLVAAFPALASADPTHGDAQVSTGALPFGTLDLAFVLGAALLLACVAVALGQARVRRPAPRPAPARARTAVPAAARR